MNLTTEENPQAHRLIVRSLGTAGFRIIAALRTVSPLSEDELALRLLRAPAELFGGLSPELAAQLAEVLGRGGLVVEVDEGTDPLAAPDPLYEVGLTCRDPAQISAVAEQVSALLGLDLRAARDHLCNAPCVLIGGVSAATVTALQARFEPLGAEIDAVAPRQSRFDAYVTSASPQIQARLLQCVADRAGLKPEAREAGAPLAILDVDYDTAQRVWQQAGRRADQVRLVTRGFLRYDLMLHAAPRRPEMIQALTELAGMPARVAERVLDRLPMVVLTGAREAAATQGAERLAALGARVSLNLATLATFQVEITSVTHIRPAQRALAALLDLPEEKSEVLLSRLPVTLPEVLSPTRARWLQQTLRQAGANAKLVSR